MQDRIINGCLITATLKLSCLQKLSAILVFTSINTELKLSVHVNTAMKVCCIIFATFQRSASNCLPMLQNPSLMTFWLPISLICNSLLYGCKSPPSNVYNVSMTISPVSSAKRSKLPAHIFCWSDNEQSPLFPGQTKSKHIVLFHCLQLNSYWPKGSVTYRYLLLEMSLWRFGGGGLVLWRFWTQTPWQISIISSKSDTENNKPVNIVNKSSFWTYVVK